MKNRGTSKVAVSLGALLLTLGAAGALQAQVIPTPNIYVEPPVSPLIAAPAIGVVAPQVGTSAVVAWGLVPNATSYLLQTSPDSAFKSGWVAYTAAAGYANGYTLANLSAPGLFVRIRGMGVANGATIYGAWSTGVPLAKATLPPAVPTNLSAVRGTDRVTLSWAASPGATSYRVVYTRTSGSGYLLGGTSTTASLVVSGLTPGVLYYFSAIAEGAAGGSQMSAPLQVVTSKLIN